MDKKLSKIIGKIDKIIDDGNIYWYYYSSNLLKPITKSTSDKKGRKIVEKYVNDNDSNIIKFIIKFEIITDLDVLKSSIKQDKGILTIYCDVYSIKSNMKISKSSSKGRSKVIWFTHDEIIEHKLNEKEFEKMKLFDIKSLIEKYFEEVNGDFDNPTKESLLEVIGKLQEFAKNFRKPKIVNKHSGEIMKLIKKLS